MPTCWNILLDNMHATPGGWRVGPAETNVLCFVCRAGIPPSLPLDGGHLSHLLGNLEPMFRHDFVIEICFHAQLTVIQLWEMKS